MKTNVHTGFQQTTASRANSHQPTQLKAGATLVDNRSTAVKQLAARTTIESSQRLVAQRQIAQRIAGGRSLASVAFTANPIIQRQVIDGSKSYSGKQIYRRYRDAFDDAGVTEDELIDYVDDGDDITKADLFRIFRVKSKRALEEDPCDEEIKAQKESKRTGASSKKRRKLYNGGLTFLCEEPTCFHSTRTITLNTDGTEHGYANKHNRLQAPPVAHHKDAPANIRISALEEVVKDFLKKKYKSFESVKLSGGYKTMRKKVEWTGKIAKHHRSHTTCNLKNKDITWSSLSEKKKKEMRSNVQSYLTLKNFDLNTL